MDWNEVYQLAQEQSVQGIVLQGIERFKNHNVDLRSATTGDACQSKNLNFDIPQILLLQWIGEVQVIEQQNKEMNAFVADLIEKLRQNDIYALLVKGQGVAQCYEKPLWRCSGDVDLFLDDVNYEKAKRLLMPLASEVETESVGSKHLGMTINDWIVELHGSLRVGLPNKINRVLDDIKTETFNRGNVRSWMNGQTEVFLLGKENDIVYVFVHFFNHFYKEGVGLRQLCDWCRLMWTYRDEIDVKKIEDCIQEMGLVSEWKAFYNLASRYLGMPDIGVGIMARDSRYDKKADRIMEFVLKSGNMGHNRDMSHFSKYPYLIRKCVSMCRRIGDLINHARIFPLDSLRFFPRIMFNGVMSAMRGE
ncbi:MAG: nucleotidyltransferase family protein [Prevotella sp.]|nr:nucleotidyltransferase family protein [Prevotella sp.]